MTIKSTFITFFIGYLILVLINLFPAWIKPHSIIGDGGDDLEYFSYVYLVKQQILQFKLPFSHTYLFNYPTGFNFYLGSDAKLFTLIGGILTLVFPTTSTFNGLIILSVVLNCLTASFLFFYISQRRLLSFIFGYVYGVSYYVLSRTAGHINLLQIYGFPLLIYYCFYQPIDFKTWSKIVIWLIIICLASTQYLIISGIILIFYFLGRGKEFITFCLNLKISYILKERFTLLNLISSILLLNLITLPYLRLIRHHYRDLTIQSYVAPKLDLNQFFTQNNFYLTPIGSFINTLLKLQVGDDVELGYFFGYLEISLAIFFILKLPKSNSHFSLIAFILFFGISVSRHPSYFLPLISQLFSLIPGYSIINELDRLFVVYYLFLLLFIVSHLSTVKSNYQHNFVLIVMLLIFILERVNFHFYSTDLSQYSETNLQSIQNLPSSAVIDLPLDTCDGCSTTRFNLLPWTYQKPIFGGYYHWLAHILTLPNALNPTFSPLYCSVKTAPLSNDDFARSTTVLKQLVRLNYRVLVVHRHLITNNVWCDNLDRLINYWQTTRNLSADFKLTTTSSNSSHIVLTLEPISP